MREVKLGQQAELSQTEPHVEKRSQTFCVRSRISSELMVGWGVNILGRTSVGIIQYRVMGTPPTKVGFTDCSFSHLPKSTVPGNGVIMTNCANVTPAFIAMLT